MKYSEAGTKEMLQQEAKLGSPKTQEPSQLRMDSSTWVMRSGSGLGEPTTACSWKLGQRGDRSWQSRSTGGQLPEWMLKSALEVSPVQKCRGRDWTEGSELRRRSDFQGVRHSSATRLSEMPCFPLAAWPRKSWTERPTTCSFAEWWANKRGGKWCLGVHTSFAKHVHLIHSFMHSFIQLYTATGLGALRAHK